MRIVRAITAITLAATVSLLCNSAIAANRPQHGAPFRVSYPELRIQLAASAASSDDFVPYRVAATNAYFAAPKASPVPVPAKVSLGVFASTAISAASLPASAKYRDAVGGNYAALFGAGCDASRLRGCDTRFAHRLGDVVAEARGMDTAAMLDRVNRAVNDAIAYVPDRRNWGAGDYWATPSEIARKGAGDCEDYAIAKYFSLIRLGFSTRDLRIVIVSDSKAHDFHAVLVANIGGADWLLDNQIPDMVRLESMPQYTPIYSLNQEGWWLHSQPVIQVAANVIITTAPITAAGPAPIRLATAN